MSDLQQVNDRLRRDAPVLAQMWSERGESLVFPRGIPFQAGQAAGCEINATIGQLTDGAGVPMPLEPLAKLVTGLEAKTSWLYSPVDGPKPLRELWLGRQLRLAGQGADVRQRVGLPTVTHGLTHAVRLLAELVADPDLDLIVPFPAWENYLLIFQHAGGCRPVRFPFFAEDGTFNLEGLERAIQGVRKKAVVLLNFPNNPTGYVPTKAEQRQIAEVLNRTQKPVIAVSDDAYQGWVYDDTRAAHSLFWTLLEHCDADRVMPVKVDGATKELVFFSSRIGFLTTPVHGEAEVALASKMRCAIRGSVGSPPGLSMAVMEHGLRDPDLEAAFAERVAMMGRRARTLRDALEAHRSERFNPLPSHGAFFALVQLDQDPDAVRERLVRDYSTGVISFASAQSLRIAFCSMTEDGIPELVRRIVASLDG